MTVLEAKQQENPPPVLKPVGSWSNSLCLQSLLAQD